MFIKLFASWKNSYLGHKTTDLSVHIEDKMRLLFHTSVWSPAFSWKPNPFCNVTKQKLMSVTSPFLCNSYKKYKANRPIREKISSKFYRTYTSLLLITLLAFRNSVSSFYRIHIISYNFMQNLAECAGALPAIHKYVRITMII